MAKSHKIIVFTSGSPQTTLTVQCKKVNKVFVIGLQSCLRDTSLQSYNEFVSSCSGVNFIIPREPLMLCRDTFFASALRSALQVNASWMWNSCTLQAICEGCEVLLKKLAPQPHKPHNINYENSLINQYKLLIPYMMFWQNPQENVLWSLPCTLLTFFALYHNYFITW